MKPALRPGAKWDEHISLSSRAAQGKTRVGLQVREQTSVTAGAWKTWRP